MILIDLKKVSQYDTRIANIANKVRILQLKPRINLMGVHQMQILKPLATALAIGLSTLPAAAGSLWSTDGFDMPESVVFDPSNDRLIVSVMVGAPNAADGNGRLALLSSDGTVLDANWATGMDAPKGLALMDGKVFAADLTRLHIVDAATGEPLASLAAEGAVFLNDVTTNGHEVFVSDMMTDTIWRYTDGTFEKWLESPALNHPNGLLWDDGRLLVGSWGRGLKDDFTTEAPGSLLSIDPKTKEISIVARDIGNIDGIVRLDGSLVLNDWINGKVFKIAEDGKASEILNEAAGLADIGAADGVLYLPHMLDGRIEAVTLD